MAEQRIAIIGSGAIGGVLAAAAHHSGHQVTLCVRTPFERLTVDNPAGSEEIPVTVVTDPSEVGEVDWVLLTTKAQDVASAAPWLHAFDGEAPMVIVQNGVEHRDSVAPLGLVAPLLPALIYVGAERLEPGHVVRRSDSALTVPEGPLGAAFAELFTDGATKVNESADFATDAWRKLLVNVTSNPITALTMRRIEVFAEPDLLVLAEGILHEAIAVAQAEGADLTTTDADRVMTALTSGWPGTNGTSMLYDRMAGLPTEHEHITAPLVEAGRRHGIPTPLNHAMLALMRAVQPTQR